MYAGSPSLAVTHTEVRIRLTYSLLSLFGIMDYIPRACFDNCSKRHTIIYVTQVFFFFVHWPYWVYVINIKHTKFNPKIKHSHLTV